LEIPKTSAFLATGDTVKNVKNQKSVHIKPASSSPICHIWL